MALTKPFRSEILRILRFSPWLKEVRFCSGAVLDLRDQVWISPPMDPNSATPLDPGEVTICNDNNDVTAGSFNKLNCRILLGDWWICTFAKQTDDEQKIEKEQDFLKGKNK